MMQSKANPTGQTSTTGAVCGGIIIIGPNWGPGI
jgi:hypothetical protein